MNASQQDRLHRLVKEAIDSGSAASVEEAVAIFRGMRLHIAIDDRDTDSEAHQAALITCVTLARRVFLGGVTVSGMLDTALVVAMPYGKTLAGAVAALGATPGPIDPNVPIVSIGGCASEGLGVFHVRTVFAGWRGGVVPRNAAIGPAERDAMPLAPMLSAALAVNQAFLFARGGRKVAGRQSVGLSLWDLTATDDWMRHDNAPVLSLLPSKLWLIGLGHLGQAYLWALGLFPYPDASDLELVLQDTDAVTESTESTSILTQAKMIGQLKTRAMAAWSAHRGFSAVVIERRFDTSLMRQEGEPAVALCGIDNALGRRALDQVGFKLIIEVGLGSGHRDFRTMRLHSLPGPRSAEAIWPPRPAGEDVSYRLAYQKLLQDGVLDQCGVTLLAGRAVGAPFVGSVAACLAISEVLRLLHGGAVSQLVDLDLTSVAYRSVIARADDLSMLNPGFVVIANR